MMASQMHLICSLTTLDQYHLRKTCKLQQTEQICRELETLHWRGSYGDWYVHHLMSTHILFSHLHTTEADGLHFLFLGGNNYSSEQKSWKKVNDTPVYKLFHLKIKLLRFCWMFQIRHTGHWSYILQKNDWKSPCDVTHRFSQDLFKHFILLSTMLVRKDTS